jgi:hypothetical protein
MTCGAEGSRSLLALCHADVLMDGGDEPVLAHLTACDRHVQAVRKWVRARSEDGVVQNVKTERLMQRWGQIITPLQVPVWTPVRATG